MTANEEAFEIMDRKIREGEYDVPASVLHSDGRVAYRHAEWDAKERFQRDLERAYRLTEVSETKRDRLFELAWAYGHDSGYNEVHCHYSEMAELVEGE